MELIDLLEKSFLDYKEANTDLERAILERVILTLIKEVREHGKDYPRR